MPFDGPIYKRSDSGPLRQGEILSDVRQIIVMPGSQGPELSVELKSIPLAIVISQDCDLSSDHIFREQARSEADPARVQKLEQKMLQNVLLCEIESALKIRDQYQSQTSQWERVVKNDDFRFHLLQMVKATEDALDQGLDPLIVAFRRYFTVPTLDLLYRIETAETKRRCYMESPYYEHVSDRFTHYNGRVGLPIDHDISGLKFKK